MIGNKCVCGYKYGSEYDEDGNEEIKYGDEEFIYSDTKVTYMKDLNWGRGVEAKSIIICPKCGTLKINLI